MKLIQQKFWAMSFFVLMLQGCLYPEKPGASTVNLVQPIAAMSADWQIMTPYQTTVSMPGTGSTIYVTKKRHKNLLFIAADNVIGEALKPELQSIYQTPVRLEEVLWWTYAPKIQKTYNVVLRLKWDGFNAQSFSTALATMDSMNQPYDVMLLAHGIPNHLIASPGQGVIDFEAINQLKKLKHADALYLQACFGNTLAPDFSKLGFSTVIAYDGLNQNFFYPEYFLEALSKYNGNVVKAHENVARYFRLKFKFNLVQRQIVKKVFASDPEIQGDASKYLESVQIPEIYSAP